MTAEANKPHQPHLPRTAVPPGSRANFADALLECEDGSRKHQPGSWLHLLLSAFREAPSGAMSSSLSHMQHGRRTF